MTTSLSTSFDLNRTGIIRVAMQRLGVLPAGQDPSTPMLEMGSDFLNVLLKELQEDGIQLWTIEQETFDLTQGVAEYVVPSDVLEIDSRTAYVSNGMTGAARVDLPLRRISRGQYMELSVKESQSQPTMIYVQVGPVVSYFLYPVPDGNWPTVTLPLVKILPDMDASDVTMGLPSKYLNCITLGLANMMSTHFPVSPAKVAKIAADAAEARDKAANDDEEKAGIRFTPNYGVRFRRV